MKFRMRASVTVMLLAITLPAPFEAKAQSAQLPPASIFPDFPVVQGKVYKFQKVAEGVYYASGGLGSNHPIIVNDNDVLLVDDANTPAATRDLLQDMKLITDKPVRYVINTHFHLDHTAGNQVFGPEVTIIGHESLRTALLTDNPLEHDPFLRDQRRNAALIDSLQKQIAEEQDAGKKTALEKQLADAQAVRDQTREIKLTPPSLTFTSKLVLHDGSREIQLLFLGRGHTAGDIAVYLPKEQIVCSGDLVTSNIAYMGDAFFGDWLTTLGELKKLDFTLVLPGHGRPFEGKDQITAFQSYIAELIKQVGALRSQGVSAEDAAKRVDLTAYQKFFPTIHGPGVELAGVQRMYQWMDQEGIK
jgi:glyoxylase-like metal-dependent hydrolase (beta-lactamase superfamily II)